MSTPSTHDPLVVTTADGASWWRRAVTQDGRGLYAVAGACNCPPYLMSTLATLAEHGIRGQADALPMPVGPVPRSELDQARDDVMGACLARWEEERDNARLRLALASAKRGRRELRARVAELEARQSVAFLVSRDSQVLGLYQQSEDALHHCEEALGRTAGYSPATPCSWQERQDGTRELFAWTSRDVSSTTGFTVARLEVRAEFDEGWGADADTEIETGPSVDESADRLTRLLAPTQALREDEAADGDRFVAYLAGGSGFLYCVNCCHGSGMYAPMTSDDLPNGGMCNGCGVDVLIEQPATGGA